MSRKVSKKKIATNTTEKGLVRISDIKKEKRIKTINKWVNILLGIVYPLVLVFLASVIQRGNFESSATWMIENMGVVFLNVLIIYTLFFVILFLFNKISVSAFVSSILYIILPIISRFKYDIRGEVLLTNDFSLATKIMELIGFLEPSKDLIILIISTIIFALIFSIVYGIKKIKTKRITSGIIAVLLVLSMIIIFVSPVHKDNVIGFFGVNTKVRYAPNVIHNKYGTIVGIYTNYLMNSISVPDDYSKEKIYEILDNVEKSQNSIVDSFGDVIQVEEQKKSEVKPNIIMIMSESFFDPYVIPNVKYSEDPIPNIRKYIKNNYSGKMITSTFAGGTSYIEFEAFTGEPTEFFPYGTVPYVDLVNQIENSETIQKVLKENGYKTIAMHSYERDFYNRDVAYTKLGFDEFYDIETLKTLWNYGKYVSDVSLVDNIISKLDEQKKSKNKEPVFVWALTMQNHTPYSTAYYDKENLYVDVEGKTLTDASKDKLKAFVNGLVETDKSMKKLLDYLDKSKEPTVVLFYGDHLPALYEVYYDAGMVSSIDTTTWTKDEMVKMHTVPFFIYDNYKKDKNTTSNNILGAAFLGNELLNYAEIEKSMFFNFMDTLNYKALRDRIFIDSNGNTFESPSSECQEKVNEHKLLQYDMIYGNDYISKYKNKEKRRIKSPFFLYYIETSCNIIS